MINHPIIVIAGPTASGKSALAYRLADYINCEIVSADSMQVYRGMDIGTDKPLKEIRNRITHYMIDIADIREPYSAYRYMEEGRACIDDITHRGKIPLIVGGTGLYIKALIHGLSDEIPEGDEIIRKRLYEEALSNSKEYLHSKLAAVDPESARAIHPNNIKRVMRALEVYEITGKPFSAFKNSKQPPESPYAHVRKVCLSCPKKDLHSRIGKRVDSMIEHGLVNEVETLISRGLKDSPTARYGLGYREIIEHLDGRLTLTETVAAIKQNTRHYAKRQMTWFRADPEYMRVDSTSLKKAFEAALRVLNQAAH